MVHTEIMALISVLREKVKLKSAAYKRGMKV
jgi:hypothetical protein